MNLAFVDVETTGLDPKKHEIIEIAILREEEDGKLLFWSTKIKPNNIETAHPKALEVNGYSFNEWKDSPRLGEVVHKMFEMIDGAYFVGYNPQFDWGFIKEALDECGVQVPKRVRLIDCMPYAFEHLVPQGLESLSFDSVRAFKGWKVAKVHGATKDVLDLYRFYCEIMNK